MAFADSLIAWGNSGPTNIPATITSVQAIAAGQNHNAVILADGKLQSWGSVSLISSPFNGATNLAAIASGYDFTIGVRSNGTVSLWDSTPGSGPVLPSTLTNVIAVGAAYKSPLAVKSDGTVFIGEPNQLYPPSGDNRFGPVPGVFNASAVAGSEYFALALKSDGTLTSWNGYSDYSKNIPPPGISNIVEIATGGYSIALTANGTVIPLTSPPPGPLPWAGTNLPPGVTNVVSIAVGGWAGMALKSDGSVIAWGGSGSPTNLPAWLTNVVAISGGGSHALAYTKQTDLFIARQPKQSVGQPFQPVLLSVGVISQVPMKYQWEFNGTAIEGATNSFYRTPPLTRVEQGAYRVVVSNSFAVLTSAVAQVTMRGNAVIASGSGYPSRVPSGLSAKGVSSQAEFAICLLADGTAAGWGHSLSGPLLTSNNPTNLVNLVEVAAGVDIYQQNRSVGLKANGVVQYLFNPLYTGPLPPIKITNAVAIAIGQNHLSGIALRRDGTLAGWDYIPPVTSNITAIAAGWRSYGAIRSDGSVMLWGNNSAITNGWPNPTNVVAISLGKAHGLALLSDGTISSFGDNVFGQTNIPSGLSNIVAVAAGTDFSMALRSDGTAETWGRNDAGQRDFPVGLTNAVGISAGISNAFVLIGSEDLAIVRQPNRIAGFGLSRVLLSVGAVSSKPIHYQWQKDLEDIPGATNAILELPKSYNALGTYRVVVSNEFGRIVSSPTRSIVPRNNVVLAPGLVGAPNSSDLTEIRSVARGIGHALASTSDGRVLAWGYSSDQNTKVPMDLTDVIEVRAGLASSFALRSDGFIVNWGYGSLTNVPPAAQSIVLFEIASQALVYREDGIWVRWGEGSLDVPVGLSNVVSLAIGGTHGIALKSDGKVVSWGGFNPEILEPPQSLNDAIAVAAGRSFTIALKKDGTVVAWGENSGGQCDVPPDATNVIAVAAGIYHGLALRQDGSVVNWGGGYSIPSQTTNVIAVSASPFGTASMALTDKRPLVIVREPINTRAFTGNPLLLSVGARCRSALNYQWRFNGDEISDATNSWLRIPTVQHRDAGIYSVRISSDADTVTSRDITVSVFDRAPLIQTQPVGQTNIGGADSTFSVSVDGSQPMEFQWRKNENPLTLSAESTVILTNLRSSNEGFYSVVVTNFAGDAISSNAFLRVLTPLVLEAFLNEESRFGFQLQDSFGEGLNLELAGKLEVSASTNLTEWVTVEDALIFTNNMFQLIDPSNNFPTRFYRVREIP